MRVLHPPGGGREGLRRASLLGSPPAPGSGYRVHCHLPPVGRASCIIQASRSGPSECALTRPD